MIDNICDGTVVKYPKDKCSLSLEQWWNLTDCWKDFCKLCISEDYALDKVLTCIFCWFPTIDLKIMYSVIVRDRADYVHIFSMFCLNRLHLNFKNKKFSNLIAFQNFCGQEETR